MRSGGKRLLALPRDRKPYQELLYDEMRREGWIVNYVGGLTRSATLNLLLLPAEIATRRLGGHRYLHLHWLFTFAPTWISRVPGARRGARWWLALTLRTARWCGLTVL